MAYPLTDLQLAILDVLWERREATVAEVHQALAAERGLAPTTVATLLSRMEKKGVVEHRTEGRQYVYRALLSEQEARGGLVSELAELSERLFDGDVAALVSHLITSRDVDADALARVKALIEQRERELGEEA